ncbi:MAG TPA: metallophosphoesterase, partial [Myxococcaceae bacterium]|nr:metallophosphoesterase [Myxococcaceae bacterium]
GLHIGGVGLIQGDPSRPGRRAPEDQLGRVASIAADELDLLVLHQGPPGDSDQPGIPQLEALIQRFGVPLTVCGHVHWERPLFRFPLGQVLNVHERGVILTR